MIHKTICSELSQNFSFALYVFNSDSSFWNSPVFAQERQFPCKKNLKPKLKNCPFLTKTKDGKQCRQKTVKLGSFSELTRFTFVFKILERLWDIKNETIENWRGMWRAIRTKLFTQTMAEKINEREQRAKGFKIWFCVIFGCYQRGFMSWGEIGRRSVSTQFGDIPNFF